MQVIKYGKDVEEGMLEEIRLKKLCPFIKKPKDDCYCIALDSLKVEATIYYCGGNFENCDIYKKQIKAEERK